MIHSMMMLKRVGESIHPCMTPTVILNQSPGLPLNGIVLWALSYRFSMTCIILALMYNPLSCPSGFVPHPVKGLLEVYEDMVKILLMLSVFLPEDPEIEYLFCGAPSRSESSLLFCNDLLSLWLELFKIIFNITLLWWLIRLMVL